MTPMRVDSAPSHAINRPCGSISSPLASLLCSRYTESTPFGVSFMIRSKIISVKYTLPSRSTVGPSVNATVAAISGCCAAADHGSATNMRNNVPASLSARNVMVTSNLSAAERALQLIQFAHDSLVQHSWEFSVRAPPGFQFRFGCRLATRLPAAEFAVPLLWARGSTPEGCAPFRLRSYPGVWSHTD